MSGSASMKVLHVDAAKIGFYETEDLDFFSSVLREIVDDLIIERSPLVAPEHRDSTKARLAIALLHCADRGERDRSRLTRQALAALHADQ